MAQHYFESDPAAESRPASVDLVLADLHLKLGTDRGVFSPGKVDLGTKVLLEAAPAPPRTGRLLDVGCGYGPIALTMASRALEASVLGVDVNGRAVDLAARNADTARLYNVDFMQVDESGAPVDGSAPGAEQGPFDAIWSNPPIRIGKPALHALLRTWLGRLAPGGAAHLVVQRNLGGDSLHRWLEEQGNPTTRTASRAGYRVLRVDRP